MSFFARRPKVLFAILLGPLCLIVISLYLGWSNWDRASHLFQPKPEIPEKSDAPQVPEVPQEEGPDYWVWETPTRFHSPVDVTSGKDVDLCADFPDYLLSSVQIVLKVGAAEPWERVEGQKASMLRCIPNILVVSDMDHTVGPHQAYDILADLPAHTHLNEKDYAIYTSQKTLKSEGKLNSSAGGWNLDKYKFLPQVERAYKVNPSAQWFIFFEADTYIVWDNMFRLLDNFDFTAPLYFGSPSPGRTPPGQEKTWFAYGGAGFVISQGAVQKLIAREAGPYGEWLTPRLSTQYADVVKRDCCGDSVLGFALWEKGARISGLWPMFNPHPLHGIPFSDLYWCQPVISMHKTRPKDMPKLWEWEQKRDRSRPLLYSDLISFHNLGTFDRRENWDAADWDGWQEGDDSPVHKNVDACHEACLKIDNCFQYTWHFNRCTFVHSIRMGSEKEPEGEGSEVERMFISGWDTEKIMKWRSDHACEQALWVKPSIKRIF